MISKILIANEQCIKAPVCHIKYWSTGLLSKDSDIPGNIRMSSKSAELTVGNLITKPISIVEWK